MAVTAASETAHQALAIINWHGRNGNDKQKYYSCDDQSVGGDSSRIGSTASVAVTAKADKRKHQSTGDSGDSNSMQKIMTKERNCL